MANAIREKEEMLTCPVCFEIAKAPIFTCLMMHLICSRCKPRVATCPECRERYREPPMRHRYAERDAEMLEKMKSDFARERA